MKITRKNWRARMSEDLLLADYTDATRESYLLSTRQLFDWLKGEPEQWDEDDVRRYFLYRRQEVAPSTFNDNLHGIRFFFRTTMGKEWPLLEHVNVKRRQHLPVVLSRKEMRSLLEVVRDAQKRTMLVTPRSATLVAQQASWCSARQPPSSACTSTSPRRTALTLEVRSKGFSSKSKAPP